MTKEILHQGPIIVKKSSIHGYGVFATENIARGQVIEECHTLIIPKEKEKENEAPDRVLGDYYFSAKNDSAIPLGYGCIYNHSPTPNIEYAFNADSQLMVFTTIKAVRRGEELCSSYGKTWFSQRDMPMKSLPLSEKIYRFLSKRPLRAMVICLGLWIFTHYLPLLSAR